MKIIISLGIFLTFFIPNISKASLVFESDPIAFAYSGSSIAVGIKFFDNFSLLIGRGEADFDEKLEKMVFPSNKNKGMDWELDQGIAVFLDYFLDPSHKGVFFGVGSVFWENTISRNGDSTTFKSRSDLLRIGARYFLGRSYFYVTPWVAFGKDGHQSGSREVDGEEFELEDSRVVGALHLGIMF